MTQSTSGNIIRKILVWGLNSFFNLLYHQLAWSYDFIAAAVSVGLWKKWVLQVGDYLVGPQILELGYGPGHLQMHIATGSNSINMFGLDSSHQMSRLASKRFKKMGLNHRLSIGNAQNLPYPNDYFHQVVATFPSNYIYSPDTLNEIKRVLSKTGSLLVLFQAKIVGRRYFFRLADWLFRITGQTRELDAKTMEMALEPFTKAGFTVNILPIKISESTIFILIAKIAKN